jgi:hypothetical protein
MPLIYEQEKTHLQSVKYSRVLNTRNLKIVWHYFYWVIVKVYQWSNSDEHLQRSTVGKTLVGNRKRAQNESRPRPQRWQTAHRWLKCNTGSSVEVGGTPSPDSSQWRPRLFLWPDLSKPRPEGDEGELGGGKEWGRNVFWARCRTLEFKGLILSIGELCPWLGGRSQAWK